MPFIRYTRDKRGYETTYVLHGYRSPQGASHTRVLYLFHSPAHVRVGRRALDEEAREALTHTHPDLTFDWTSLGHTAGHASPHAPAPDRHGDPRGFREERAARHGARGHEAAAPAASQVSSPVSGSASSSISASAAASAATSVAASAPSPIAIHDETPLGQVLGAAEAARLRTRYAELAGRIARRARTPEERDRLTDRLHRLNPDEWPDESAIRAGAAAIEADWNGIAAELPHRRRGRRGGQRRHGLPSQQGAPSSGILDPNEGAEHASADAAEDSLPDRGAGGAGDGRTDGADADAGVGVGVEEPEHARLPRDG